MFAHTIINTIFHPKSAHNTPTNGTRYFQNCSCNLALAAGDLRLLETDSDTIHSFVHCALKAEETM